MPEVIYGTTAGNLNKPIGVKGKSHLIPYPRESAEKFASRVACATYENHLRSACERFAAYLSRKSPSRQGADNPLVQAFLKDADGAGSSLNAFIHRLTIDAKARGSMLVLIDLPRERQDVSLAQTLTGEARTLPYLAAIKPEVVADYKQDDKGRFVSLGIHSVANVNGKEVEVIRRWTRTDWQVWNGQQLLESGPNPFGECPVLALTENGAPFPQVGKFAQIADLSKRLYNARSELDEILRSQTFSVLTLQIPPEVTNAVESAKAFTETISTHSLLIHQGQTPAFIAPDSGPAQVYGARIAELQASIERIGMETASQPGQQQESGVARKMRFEALNADLAGFAALMQDLELRIWDLFHQALGMQDRPLVEWPTDYNLTDSAAELDILSMMQATGFPDAALIEKRRAILLAEFDRADPATLAIIMAALDESAQSGAKP